MKLNRTPTVNSIGLIILALLGAGLIGLPTEAAAQTWRSSVSAHPITDKPVASASIEVGGAISGWKLVAWCGETDDRGMRWQVRVDTHDIISSYFSTTDVVIRFDAEDPTTFANKSIGGSYNNTVTLLASEYSSATELVDLVTKLKSASRLAVQIKSLARVFPLNGSTKALTRWMDHCGLSPLPTP